MSGQITSQEDVLIHNPVKEKGFFPSSENEQELREMDRYAFFLLFFFFFLERNGVMSLNSGQSGV